MSEQFQCIPLFTGWRWWFQADEKVQVARYLISKTRVVDTGRPAASLYAACAEILAEC